MAVPIDATNIGKLNIITCDDETCVNWHKVVILDGKLKWDNEKYPNNPLTKAKKNQKKRTCQECGSTAKKYCLKCNGVHIDNKCTPRKCSTCGESITIQLQQYEIPKEVCYTCKSQV